MEKISLLVAMPLVKNEQGEMLAQIRRDENFPVKHMKWELSGGKVEWGETAEQAVVRETKEETGLDVEVVSMWPKLYTQYWTHEGKQVEYKVTLIPFVCNIIGGELTPHPEDEHIEEVRFIKPEEVEILPWGSDIDKNLMLEFSKL